MFQPLTFHKPLIHQKDRKVDKILSVLKDGLLTALPSNASKSQWWSSIPNFPPLINHNRPLSVGCALLPTSEETGSGLTFWVGDAPCFGEGNTCFIEEWALAVVFKGCGFCCLARPSLLQPRKHTNSVVHTFNCFDLSAAGTLLVTCAVDCPSSV